VKRSILAAVAVLLMAITAQAGPISKLSLDGWWEVSYNASNRDGNPMCVMAAKHDWADGTNGGVYLKWTTQGGARWQVWHSSWRMTKGWTVPMSVTFTDLNRDAPPPQTITADAKAINDGRLISFDIKGELRLFLKMFGDAEEMKISFPQSHTWTLKMDGNLAAASSFEQCITKIRTTPQPEALTDDAIAAIIMMMSRNRYYATGKPCACPDDKARNNTSCGGRSAYSRNGGAEPLCYRRDITPGMIEQHRLRQASR